MTRITFFGSSNYSVTILQKLLTLPQFSLGLIVTKLDKPVGRDQQITPNPVAKFAVENNLPLLQLEEFTPQNKSAIGQSASQLGLCVAFGPPFFDDETINLFPLKIINIHPSPLPKYRGATPGPWQIINGETSSAVTFFQIDLLPDHGPIISQIPFQISPSETGESFYQKAFSLAADNLGPILDSYILNPESVSPQDHSQKSYYPKFTKDTAKIDWSWPVDKISRFVRALIPWPVAWTEVQNSQGQILKMKIFSFNVDPVEVQLEGKTKTDWNQIKNYYKILKNQATTTF